MNKRNGQEKQRRVKAKKTVAFIPDFLDPNLSPFRSTTGASAAADQMTKILANTSLNLNSTASKRFNLLSLDGVVRMCVSKRLMTKKVDPGPGRS